MTIQLSRRHFLRGLGGAGALAVAGLARPDRAWTDDDHVPDLPVPSGPPDVSSPPGLPAETLAAIEKSPLIYISPLKTNGAESTCHAEVWFVKDGDDLVVVTEPSGWRAACIDKGLDRARLWVGDYGVWTRAEGRYKKAPSFVTRVSIDTNTDAHARALAAFGKKYPDAWENWGPRFEKGLASGERVLLRYRPPS